MFQIHKMKIHWQVRNDFSWTNGEISVGKATTSIPELNMLKKSSNPRKTVRLHMGLKGDYRFSCSQLNSEWDLIGGHHNIMFSEGMDLEIQNRTKEIQTFGIEFTTELFSQLFKNKSRLLKKFCNQISEGNSAILSNEWGAVDHRMQTIINQMVSNPYRGSTQDVYLYAKSLELLVLCIEDYPRLEEGRKYIQTSSDKEAIIAAREFIINHFKEAPNLNTIARHVGMNEFKLKYGFQEIFGLPIFSFMIEYRLDHAEQLLLQSTKPIAIIADELGYSSPQHFSNQFKEKRGLTPSSFRNTKPSIHEGLPY